MSLRLSGLFATSSLTNDIYTPIVITAPVLQLPVELEKKITVLELPLPDADEIAELIDGAIEQLRAWKPDAELPDEVGREALIKAGQGLTEQELENILAKSWTKYQRLDVKVMLEEKSRPSKRVGFWSTTRILRNSVTSAAWISLKSGFTEGGMPLARKRRGLDCLNLRVCC